ncbi:MAG: hypothetical protein RIT28_5051 [Pseudomonadota bacterium]
MRQVFPGIFIDGTPDKRCLHADPGDDLAVIHAAKDPCHRRALGYTTRSAPKDHPHEVFMRDGRHLILNMVDAPDPKYFSPLMFHQARDFAAEHRASGRALVIHCNEGRSRSTSVALVILATSGVLPCGSYAEARAAYEALDPLYAPGVGVRLFLETRWAEVTGVYDVDSAATT